MTIDPFLTRSRTSVLPVVLALLLAPSSASTAANRQRALEAAHEQFFDPPLPAGLLHAVAWVESTDDDDIDIGWDRGPGRKDCVLSKYGILVKRCRSSSASRTLWLLRKPGAAVGIAAALLAESREACAQRAKWKDKRQHCLCDYDFYNWNGRTEWCRRLAIAMTRNRLM